MRTRATMWKRALAFFLSAVMVYSLLGVSAFAEGNMQMSFIFTDTEYSPITSAKVGDTVFLGIKADNYMPVISYAWRISYDSSKLDFAETFNRKILDRYPEFENGVDKASKLAPSTVNPVEDMGYVIATSAYDTAVDVGDLDENSVMFYLAFTVIGAGDAEVSFDTTPIGNYKWATETTGGASIPVDLATGSLQVLAPGVTLDKTTVEVNGTVGGTVNATAYDANLQNVTGTVTWSVTPADQGVTVAGGVVTVDATAKSDIYTVSATDADFGTGSNSAQFTVTRAGAVPTAVTVSLDGNTLTVPADDSTDTADITTTVTDQYGDTMTGFDVQYSIDSSMDGISVQGNQVVVTNAAKADITDTTGKTFTLTATVGSAKGETAFTVARALQEATDVVIYKGDTPITSDTIAVPKGTESTSVTYTAKVLDQYGTEMGAPEIWLSRGTSPNGVYVACDENGSTITVNPAAETGSFQISAKYNENSDLVSDEVTITIVDIAFTGEPTIKENPVYGDTWGDIVTGLTNITANIGGVPVEGTYTLENADTMPAAGENQEYRVLFTSNDGTYTNIVAAKGNVKIAPKPVIVTGITAADKVYDGTTAATLDWSKASVTETVGGDVLTVNSATGAFASKNVGSQTVTISNITLDGNEDGNYTVSASTTTASITAKTLTDLDFTDIEVTKTYDGTTNPGTLSGNVTFTGKVDSDDVAISAQPGQYSDANVGTDKKITLTLSLTGNDAGNYALADTTASFAAAITASSEYTDATAKEQNVVVGVGDFAEPTFTGHKGETVTGTTTYSYDDKTTYDAIKAALAGLTANQTAAIEYTFTASGNYTGETTGTISVTMVDIAFTGKDEGVTVNSATYGDDWSKIVTIDPSKITAMVGEKTITGGTYTLEQTGVPSAGSHPYKVLFSGELDGKAYTNVEVKTGTVEVAKKKVTVAGITAVGKVYDGDTDAELNYDGVQIDGKIGEDVLTVTATGAFADENVGTGKTITITGITLGGEAVANYELVTTTLTATASITAKAVTVTGITAADKEYDGTVAATLNTASAQFAGKIGDDELSVTATGAFADADAAKDKTVAITGITLGGADAGNYTVSADSQKETTAKIDPTDNYILTVSETQTVVVGVGTFAQPSASFGGKKVAGTVTYTIGTDADKTYEEAEAILAAKKAGDSVTVTCTFTPTAGGNFTGEKTGEIEVTMVDIAFTLAAGAVTEKDAPVYGDDWSEIVTIDPGKITAKVGEETVTGTYRLDVSGMPAVGTYGYQVLFTGTLGDKTYTDITVTSGSVTVGKKLVVVAALDRNITQGQKAPDLSQPKLGTDYTVSGLVGADTLGGTIVMNYDPAEPDTTKIGTAVINISGATVGGNYDIAFQSGKLTISYIPPYIPGTGGSSSNTQVNPDGSITTTTTSPSGTVTQTTKYPNGAQTVTVTAPDGSASITTTTADGSRAVTTVDTAGKAVSSVTLSAAAMNNSGTKAQPAVLPVPAAVNTSSILNAAVVTVSLPAGTSSAWVEIPVSSPTMGTVAMVSRADGGLEVLKASYAADGSLVAKVSSGDQIIVVDNSQTFRDVAYTAWEYDAVAFVSSHGLFQGTGENSFSPKATTSRAMVMTVLARLAGYDTEGGATWYEKGMAWSVANGVSDGSNPNGAVSREQFATMLYRYVGSPAVSGSLAGFIDADEISGYAESAMLWAVQNGIMSGKGNGVLDPQGSATRAELSQMLMNFIVNVME